MGSTVGGVKPHRNVCLRGQTAKKPVRNPYAAHIDFTELTGLLGKVVPSNLDMVYERKGSFLVAEWKRDGEKVSKGQEILLKALSRIPSHTVLIINGYTEDREMFVNNFFRVFPDSPCVLAGSGLIGLKDYITDWYLTADVANVEF
jgi:hypothetical protein